MLSPLQDLCLALVGLPPSPPGCIPPTLPTSPTASPSMASDGQHPPPSSSCLVFLPTPDCITVPQPVCSCVAPSPLFLNHGFLNHESVYRETSLSFRIPIISHQVLVEGEHVHFEGSKARSLFISFSEGATAHAKLRITTCVFPGSYASFLLLPPQNLALSR